MLQMVPSDPAWLAVSSLHTIKDTEWLKKSYYWLHFASGKAQSSYLPALKWFYFYLEMPSVKALV